MNRRDGAGTWLAVVGLLIMMGCGSGEETPAARADGAESNAPPSSLAERLDDARLASAVRLALLDTTTLRRYDFAVEVVQGRVALRGTVGTDTERRLAEDLARRVPGVEAVVNHVVAPDTTRRRDTLLVE